MDDAPTAVRSSAPAVERSTTVVDVRRVTTASGNHPRALGDVHNFGRRVVADANRIIKPRTVVWERLILSGNSSLRRLLDESGGAHGFAQSGLGFLPDLQFRATRTGTAGEVERIELDPLPDLSSAGRRELARVVGRALAFWSWFGVADLHWENLALGVTRDGAVVFFPLDIEMILGDLSLPTETQFLPAAGPELTPFTRHACGVRRALPYLGKPVRVDELVAIAGAYRSMLAFLDRLAPRIAGVFADLPGLRTTPIRVCLRGTDEYVRAGTEPLWPPLLDAEAEQLDRGDIPYFFRWYGRPGIHYYRNRALTSVGTLPRVGDVPQLGPLLQVSRGFRSPSRKRLREAGVLAVLAAFDHASMRGRHRVDEIDVRFGARSFTVRLPRGKVLQAERPADGHAGSVYLPCRCGEVHAVFVPEVTRCNARRVLRARTRRAHALAAC